MFQAMDISASGLTAQRIRMNTIANNVANINTTHDEHGRAVPFQRQVVLFSAGGVNDQEKLGVKVPEIRDDNKGIRLEHNPTHPDADKDGYVAVPNINMIEEMTDMILATRAYEANVTVMESSKNMMSTALRLLA